MLTATSTVTTDPIVATDVRRLFLISRQRCSQREIARRATPLHRAILIRPKPSYPGNRSYRSNPINRSNRREEVVEVAVPRPSLIQKQDQQPPHVGCYDIRFHETRSRRRLY
jgi:hypothetical protein